MQILIFYKNTLNQFFLWDIIIAIFKLLNIITHKLHNNKCSINQSIIQHLQTNNLLNEVFNVEQAPLPFLLFNLDVIFNQE